MFVREFFSKQLFLLQIPHKMFNATVAGTSKNYLRSECVSDSGGGSRIGSRCNINEVEWGASRNIKVNYKLKTLLMNTKQLPNIYFFIIPECLRCPSITYQQ